jgi:hypothetical protein
LNILEEIGLYASLKIHWKILDHPGRKWITPALKSIVRSLNALGETE